MARKEAKTGRQTERMEEEEGVEEEDEQEEKAEGKEDDDEGKEDDAGKEEATVVNEREEGLLVMEEGGKRSSKDSRGTQDKRKRDSKRRT